MEDFDISADIAMLLGQKDLEIARLRVQLRQAESALTELAPRAAPDAHVTHIRTVPNADGEPVQV